MRAEQETADRKFQTEWQTTMLKLAETIMPTITAATNLAADALGIFNSYLNDINKFFEDFKKHSGTILTVLGVLAGATGIGLAIKMFGGLGNAGKGLMSVFSGLKNAFSGAINWLKGLFGMGGGKPGPTLGADGRYRDANGRFAAAPAAGGGGRLANLAKGGARILGKLALPLTAGMAAYDAYQGYNADPNASFGGKMANAGKGALSGMTFGLSDYITGGVTTGKQEELQEKAKETTTKQADTATKNEKTTDKTIVSNEKTSTQNKKTTDSFDRIVAAFGKIVAANGKIVVAFADLVKRFGESVKTFDVTIKDLITKLSSITGTTGTTGLNANSLATVDNVMAMQLAKESAGGTQLRAKGLGNAKSMGGGYGMGDDARTDAFKSMSKEERTAFAAATGFTKAPTLNDLVNKEGTAFLSDKAKIADEMLARKHNENAITSMTKKLGRAPTMKDLRGSNWLGPAGYPAFLKALADNPNMTMGQFYAQHPEWSTPDMKQFGGANTTLAAFDQILVEHAGGAGGGSLKDLVSKGAMKLGGGLTGNMRNLDNIDPSLENSLAAAISEYFQKTGKAITLTSGYRYPGDQANIDSGSNPKAQPGMSRHERGLAIDINSSDVSALNGLGLLSKHGLIGGQASSRQGGYIGDPPHIELKAARGGLFNGPSSGYPVELHGQEIVAPLTMDSILMKLAKTSALSAEGNMIEQALTGGGAVASGNNNTDAVLKMHSELISVLTNKLDSMIDVLDDGNDTREKIFKHSMV